MGNLPVVQVMAGPLAEYEAGFRAELERLGYAPSSVATAVGTSVAGSNGCRWPTGLRVSEACNLDRGDVDLAGGVCRARMIGGRL